MKDLLPSVSWIILVCLTGSEFEPQGFELDFFEEQEQLGFRFQFFKAACGKDIVEFGDFQLGTLLGKLTPDPCMIGQSCVLLKIKAFPVMDHLPFGPVVFSLTVLDRLCPTHQLIFCKNVQLAGGVVGKGIETPPQNSKMSCPRGKHFFKEILSQIFKNCWLVGVPPQTAPPPINKPLQQPTAL